MVLPPLDMSVVLFYAFSFVFMLWPLVLLSPLQGNRSVLPGMVAAWIVLALMRFSLVFLSKQLSFFALILEPLNTVLFLLSGVVLLLFLVLRKRWCDRRRRIDRDRM